MTAPPSWARPRVSLPSPGDLKEVVVLSVLAVVALLPQRCWLPICRALVRIPIRRGSPYLRYLARHLPAPLARAAGGTRQRAVRHFEVLHYIERAQALRSWTPWGWKPEIRLEGLDRLEAALARGHGAILWVPGFASSDLISKMALARAGHPPSHLSRPTHGGSRSPWGMKYINPIRTRIEDRYLRERVRIDQRGSVAALRTLHRRLGENGVVTITLTYAASTVYVIPFLDGHIRIPSGPVDLARSSRATIMPLYALPGPAGGFDVRIGEPFPNSLLGDSELAAQRFAAELEVVVLANPLAWTAWRTWLYVPPGIEPPSEGSIRSSRILEKLAL